MNEYSRALAPGAMGLAIRATERPSAAVTFHLCGFHEKMDVLVQNLRPVSAVK
jgi:hypothetical protein